MWLHVRLQLVIVRLTNANWGDRWVKQTEDWNCISPQSINSNNAKEQTSACMISAGASIENYQATTRIEPQTTICVTSLSHFVFFVLFLLPPITVPSPLHHQPSPSPIYVALGYLPLYNILGCASILKKVYALAYKEPHVLSHSLESCSILIVINDTNIISEWPNHLGYLWLSSKLLTSGKGKIW